MNTDLEPPLVPPLSASERARMRHQLMQRTGPATRHPARRWAAPLVGVTAVGAVVAGTLAITQNSSDDRGAAGRSSLASPEAKVGVDLGAVSKADLAKVTAECQFPGEAGPAQILWSRHVRGITRDSTALVGLARDTSKTVAPPPTAARGGRKPGSVGAPSTTQLGYRFCLTRVPPNAELGAIGMVARVEDRTWQTEPTAERPLVALGGTNGGFAGNPPTLQSWALYRTLPDVATVEARYVRDGKPGPWIKGVVDSGFAYTEVLADGRLTPGLHLKTEVRAFDAQGHPIPVG